MSGMISSRITLVVLVAVTVTVLSFAPRAFAAPVNDDFQDAIAVSAIPYSNTQSTVDATLQPPDEPSCAGMEATVWYAVTAPQSGILKITTHSSDFDTVLAAHSGSGLASLVSLACNDDVGPSLDSAVQFAVVSGTTYYIQVGGVPSAPSGQLEVSMGYGVAPANDNFGSAVAVPQSLPYANSRDTIVATTEPNEPVDSPDTCVPIGRTVWYPYTPSQTRLVSATTTGSNFDTVIAVYTGDTLAGLTEVACDDDTDVDVTSAVRFVANGGTIYRIQAGGYLGDSGNLVFNLSVDTSDTDGDGFTDESEELYIDTSPTDPCGNDGWPAELVGNDNRLNIADSPASSFPRGWMARSTSSATRCRTRLTPLSPAGTSTRTARLTSPILIRLTQPSMHLRRDRLCSAGSRRSSRTAVSALLPPRSAERSRGLGLRAHCGSSFLDDIILPKSS